jgi:hypothetical protein
VTTPLHVCSIAPNLSLADTSSSTNTHLQLTNTGENRRRTNLGFLKLLKGCFKNSSFKTSLRVEGENYPTMLPVTHTDSCKEKRNEPFVPRVHVPLLPPSPPLVNILLRSACCSLLPYQMSDGKSVSNLPVGPILTQAHTTQ